VGCSHAPKKKSKKTGAEGSVAGSSTGFEEQVLDRLDRIEVRFDRFLRMFEKGKFRAMTESESESEEDEEEEK